VPCGVPAEGLALRLAIGVDLRRDIRPSLRDKRRLDELDREACLQMPLDVTVEKPDAWVVRDKSGGASGIKFLLAELKDL
jgi:hypothetical protein